MAAKTLLKGNEVAPNIYADDVAIDQLRQAIRSSGKLTEKRVPWMYRPEVKDKLKHWAARIYDKVIFYKASGITFQDAGSNTVFEAGDANTNIIYAGDKTALSELTASDTFNLDMLLDAKTCAETGYLGTTKIYKMRPVMVEGEPHYVALLHPYQINAIKKTDLWRDAVMNARERSRDNPIFRGSVALWENIIIRKHDLVYRASDAGAGGNVDYATALLLGAQSLIYAPATDGFDWIEQTFDYGQKWGIATGFISGFAKTQFNSKDFATIALKTAARNPLAT